MKEPREEQGCIKTLVGPSTLAFVGPSFHKNMLIIFHDSMDINMNINHAEFNIIYSLLFHSGFFLNLKEIEIYTFPWALKILWVLALWFLCQLHKQPGSRADGL